MALREGVRCGLLQMAIDKVKDGIDPEYPFASDEHREYYERQVKDLQAYMDQVGPEQFSATTFDIEHNYDDDEDDDDPWGSL